MAYSAIDDARFVVDAPIRATDHLQMNTNVKDHEARLLAIEDPLNFSEHFVDDHGYPSGLIISEAAPETTSPTTIDPDAGFGADTGLVTYANERMILACQNGSWTEAISGASTTDAHYIRATGSTGARVTSAVHFANRTSPVTMTMRLKMSANPTTSDWFCGFYDGAIYTTSRPTNGIYVEWSAANTWRFTSSRAGSNTAGTGFTAPTAGAWFELKIIISDSGGNHAECYIDSVLKEDISLTLPVDRQIFASLSWTQAANKDIDRWTLASAGIDDAA